MHAVAVPLITVDAITRGAYIISEQRGTKSEFGRRAFCWSYDVTVSGINWKLCNFEMLGMFGHILVRSRVVKIL